MAAGSIIDAATTGKTLENVDNTIIGIGQIGQGEGNLTLVNDGSGVIDADFGILSLNTHNAIINAGTLEATHGGNLKIFDDVSNSGTIDADDPAAGASTVNIAGSLTNTSLGLVEATNGGHLNISGGLANSGTIEADGSDTAGASTVTIDSAGTNTNLIIASNGGALVVDAAITNSGTVDGSDGTLTIDATGKIVGTGTIAGGFINKGLIEASGGTLHVTGDVSGTGSAEIDANSVLDLHGSDAQTVLFNGANAELMLGARRLVHRRDRRPRRRRHNRSPAGRLHARRHHRHGDL